MTVKYKCPLGDLIWKIKLFYSILYMIKSCKVDRLDNIQIILCFYQGYAWFHLKNKTCRLTSVNITYQFSHPLPY